MMSTLIFLIFIFSLCMEPVSAIDASSPPRHISYPSPCSLTGQPPYVPWNDACRNYDKHYRGCYVCDPDYVIKQEWLILRFDKKLTEINSNSIPGLGPIYLAFVNNLSASETANEFAENLLLRWNYEFRINFTDFKSHFNECNINPGAVVVIKAGSKESGRLASAIHVLDPEILLHERFGHVRMGIFGYGNADVNQSDTVETNYIVEYVDQLLDDIGRFHFKPLPGMYYDKNITNATDEQKEKQPVRVTMGISIGVSCVMLIVAFAIGFGCVCLEKPGR